MACNGALDPAQAGQKRDPSNGIGRRQTTAFEIRNTTKGIKQQRTTAADIKIHQRTSTGIVEIQAAGPLYNRWDTKTACCRRLSCKLTSCGATHNTGNRAAAHDTLMFHYPACVAFGCRTPFASFSLLLCARGFFAIPAVSFLFH
jgi:hypothetical protein